MNAPDRSAEVVAWVSRHRVLFTGDADTKTRELLTPLAQHLNLIEGRDAWGVLVKRDRQPPFIPHDILMWKDTREHFDVFTGPDSGRAEDVQAAWGVKGVPPDEEWVWQSVEDDVVKPPVNPPPTDAELLTRVSVLEATVSAQARWIEDLELALKEFGARVKTLEDTPAPVFTLPALVVKGNTSRVWGHGHRIELEVTKT